MTDAERFTQLFRSRYRYVLSYARRRVGDSLAEEVVEDVFLAAWRHLAELPDDPLPWLYRAASYEISHRRRRLAREDRLRDALGTGADRQVVPDPADQVAWGEKWTSAFAFLSERDREVLRLAAWEQLPPAGAAFVLGCSLAAYKVRLHRARRRLARLLSTDTEQATPAAGAPSDRWRAPRPGGDPSLVPPQLSKETSS